MKSSDNLRLLSFLNLVFILLFANVGRADHQKVAEVLSKAKMYLFTNPDNCSYCRRLEDMLSHSNQVNMINVNFAGERYSIPIVRRDPWAEDAKDHMAQYKIEGYLGGGIPQFSLVVRERWYPFG